MEPRRASLNVRSGSWAPPFSTPSSPSLHLENPHSVGLSQPPRVRPTPYPLLLRFLSPPSLPRGRRGPHPSAGPAPLPPQQQPGPQAPFPAQTSRAGRARVGKSEVPSSGSPVSLTAAGISTLVRSRAPFDTASCSRCLPCSRSPASSCFLGSYSSFSKSVKDALTCSS